MNYKPELDAMRSFYKTGVTRAYNFRIQQLKTLQRALLQHEEEIYEALYMDLRKSREEAFVTELGLVLGEIRLMLRKLKGWMRPQTVATNLVNLPGKSIIYRDSLGVLLVIAPWNYPLQLSMMAVAGAIATGNCAVVKPSEHAPATAAVINKIISQHFNQDYLRVVEGDGEEVVNAMMEVFRFDHLFYTGSTVVGKLIYQKAAARLIPVTLELGGKSPCIVEEDANIAVTAKRIVFGKFLNVGQTCIAPDYILVQHSIKNELVTALKNAIEKMYGQQPEQSYDYGRIINHKRFDTLIRYLDEGKVLYGGQHDRAQLYIAPTLLDEPGVDAPVMKDEIFGPILPILGFSTREEATAIINKNPNPLALYVFSSSTSAQQFWVDGTVFGGGCINNTVVQFANSSLPLGGVGNSGIGRYHGKFSFEEMTRLKPVLKSATWIDPAMKYPPFKNKLGFFKRILS